jgi:hypothetical protein
MVIPNPIGTYFTKNPSVITNSFISYFKSAPEFTVRGYALYLCKSLSNLLISFFNASTLPRICSSVPIRFSEQISPFRFSTLYHLCLYIAKCFQLVFISTGIIRYNTGATSPLLVFHLIGRGTSRNLPKLFPERITATVPMTIGNFEINFRH